MEEFEDFSTLSKRSSKGMKRETEGQIKRVTHVTFYGQSCIEKLVIRSDPKHSPTGRGTAKVAIVTVKQQSSESESGSESEVEILDEIKDGVSIGSKTKAGATGVEPGPGFQNSQPIDNNFGNVIYPAEKYQGELNSPSPFSFDDEPPACLETPKSGARSSLNESKNFWRSQSLNLNPNSSSNGSSSSSSTLKLPAALPKPIVLRGLFEHNFVQDPMGNIRVTNLQKSTPPLSSILDNNLESVPETRGNFSTVTQEKKKLKQQYSYSPVLMPGNVLQKSPTPRKSPKSRVRKNPPTDYEVWRRQLRLLPMNPMSRHISEETLEQRAQLAEFVAAHPELSEGEGQAAAEWWKTLSRNSKARVRAMDRVRKTTVAELAKLLWLKIQLVLF